MGEGANDKPFEVSVVVASFSGEASLARCLGGVVGQGVAAEVIVPTTVAPEALRRLEASYPDVRFVAAPVEEDVFRLRSRGIGLARGRLIVLTEDHCITPPGWLRAYVEAHREGRAVMGGAVEHAPGLRVRDWALYCCEYAGFMPPVAEGSASILSGVNAAYDREALLGCRETWRDGFHENEVHDALRGAGHPLHLVEGATVQSAFSLPLRHGMAHLFAGGRRFGGYRRSRSTAVARGFWVAASPAVPLVLLARIVRSVAGRRPDRVGALVRGLPHMLVLLLAWSAGEAWSYLGFASSTRALERPEGA